MKHIILIALFFTLTTSCTSHLELDPVSTISSNSFWKTQDDATGALNGMYSRLRGVTARNLFLWGEARSQSLEQSVGNDFSNLRIFDNTLDATAAGPDWTSLYRVINDANYIITYVPTINDFKSEEIKNRYIAEAITMRAYCYFILAKTWGPVPLVNKPTEGFNPSELYKTRSSLDEVFEFIKSDINNALSLFSNNDFTVGRNRWSKPSANALKADVNLWTGKILNGGNTDFQVALQAIEEIENSDVELLEDFERVFDYDNKGNKEILMSNTFRLFESGGTFMSNMYLDGYPPNSDPTDVEVIGALGGGSYWTLTDVTLSKFNDQDQRKHKSFTELHYSNEPDGSYDVFYGCIQRKFNGVVEGGQRQFLDDVVLYRYAEVLLMKAEALNALGQDPSKPINRIRKRAYGDQYPNHMFISGTQESNDDEIIEERLLEFLYEGKYWWDILRFDKADDLIPYFNDNPNDTHKYLWPLSLDILSEEPNVTQNPGY